MRTFRDRILTKAKRVPLLNSLRLILLKLCVIKKEQFTCPICRYHGPFTNIHPETGIRKYAACPKCEALERHRLQYLVIDNLAKRFDFSKMSILHFAPEKFFLDYFRKLFKQYTSTDFVMKNVDYQADLLNLPFGDDTYDFVFASHVLEHIKDDKRALSEICRILRPNGIAVLPVPITSYETVEYLQPNPHESGHVRSAGPDYFKKYSLFFNKVETFDSNDFSIKYQVFTYEDRTCWPTVNMPLRPAMEGDKHLDIVPVCFV